MSFATRARLRVPHQDQGEDDALRGESFAQACVLREGPLGARGRQRVSHSEPRRALSPRKLIQVIAGQRCLESGLIRRHKLVSAGYPWGHESVVAATWQQ